MDTKAYFPKATYESGKKKIAEMLNSFAIGWDSEQKAWIGERGKIIGAFEGYKKPALLSASGDEDFIKSFVELCKEIGAEIRDAEIKDIRVKQQEEIAEKEAEKVRTEKFKQEMNRGIEESRLHVIEFMVSKMRKAGMSDNSIKMWVRKDTGAEIELQEEVVKVIRVGEPDNYSAKDLYAEIEAKYAGNSKYDNNEIIKREEAMVEEIINPSRRKGKSKRASSNKSGSKDSAKKVSKGDCGIPRVTKGLSIACPDNCKYVIDGRCTWGE